MPQRYFPTALRSTTLPYAEGVIIMTKMHASAVSGAHIPKALWRYAKAAARDIALLYFIPLLVVFSDSAAESVRESLKMCAAALIPSLFPYLVLTALISRCGTTEHIGRAIGQPFSMLFGLPGSLAFSFIIGMCAGYPAGAAAVCEAYRGGRCTADEAERGCALLNNTGPGLTVALIGTALLGDRRLGIIIYLAQLLSVLTLGALHGGIHNIGKRKKENRLGNVCAGQRVRYDKSLSDSTATHSSVLRVLPESVASALSATLTVVSLVTVFSLLRVLAAALLDRIYISLTGAALPPIATLLLSMLLEVSGGLGSAATFGGTFGTVLCGTEIGWSGLCVTMQTKTLMRGCGLSGKYIIPVRAAMAVLCAGYTFLLLYIAG